MPEMYDYALQSLIPDAAVVLPLQQWNAFEQIISYSGDGRINTMVSRLLDLAAGQNKLDGARRPDRGRRQEVPGVEGGPCAIGR